MEDATDRLPCYGIQGVTPLEFLDRLEWSGSKLFVAALLGCSTIIGLLFVLSGGLAGNPNLVEAFGSNGYLVLNFQPAATVSMALVGAVAGPRVIQDALVRDLRAVYPQIQDDITRLRPTPAWRWINVLSALVLMLGIIEFGVLQDSGAGISYLQPLSFFTAGPGAAVTFLVIYPVSIVIFAQLTTPVAAEEQFLLHCARTVRIDIFRAEQYAALALPAVLMFCGVSLIAGIVLAGAVLQEDPAMQGGFYLALAALGFFSALGLANLVRPIVVLRNRISERIELERQSVLDALQGHPERLKDSQYAHDYDRAEQLAYLGVLDTLNEWPVGPHLQRIVLFGLLPPAAWVLAASVENLLY